MKTFVLPDLGEGLKDAEIVAWHVAPGDHVVADQPLVSVETAKAVVEIPAPWSGRIVRIFGAPHDVIAIGTVLVEIETEGVTDSGAVVGELPAATVTAPSQPPAGTKSVKASAASQVRASPAVRQRAASLGVDLTGIAGTGPGGAITVGDIESRAGKASVPEGYEPLRGVRRAMAEAMAKVRSEIVPACVMDEAIIETWTAETDPTMRLIRATAAGCRASPALNAWFDSAACSRRLHDNIALGLALETVDGLFVPVVRDVARRTESELRAALDAIKRDISRRTIAAADLQGQTITLSNFGMLGGRHAVLTVMPPQVAILGAGRIHRGVRAVGSDIKAVRVLPLSLSFDHRAVTGAEACRFMEAVIADLSI